MYDLDRPCEETWHNKVKSSDTAYPSLYTSLQFPGKQASAIAQTILRSLQTSLEKAFARLKFIPPLPLVEEGSLCGAKHCMP